MSFKFIKEQIEKSENDLKTVKDYARFLDDLYDMIDKLEIEVERKLDDSYNIGYEDGYDDGYADGINDGE